MRLYYVTFSTSALHLLPFSLMPYSGYFSGGNIFLVFVVERRTTKYLPTKNTACARPKYEANRATTKFFPRNSQNYDFHENITPRKIPAIRYLQETITSLHGWKHSTHVNVCHRYHPAHTESKLSSPAHHAPTILTINHSAKQYHYAF